MFDSNVFVLDVGAPHLWKNPDIYIYIYPVRGFTLLVIFPDGVSGWGGSVHRAARAISGQVSVWSEVGSRRKRRNVLLQRRHATVVWLLTMCKQTRSIRARGGVGSFRRSVQPRGRCIPPAMERCCVLWYSRQLNEKLVPIPKRKEG